MTSLIWVKYITNRLSQFVPLCCVIFHIHILQDLIYNKETNILIINNLQIYQLTTGMNKNIFNHPMKKIRIKQVDQPNY